MEQLYAEAGCKPQKRLKDTLIKAAIITAIVLCILFGFLTGFMPVAFVGVIGIVLAVYLFPRFNVEYEYIFCDGQLDFDKIMGGNKRKTVLRIDFETTEMVGPVDAHQLKNYEKMKTKDFSSGLHPEKVYAAVTSVKDETVRVLFEPSEKMVEAMWTKSPRKVVKKA